MVSHLPNPKSTIIRQSDSSSSSTQPAVSLRTWIGAMILLPVAGLILGAITTGVGKAIVEVYTQVSTRSFGDLLELLVSIVLSLINVMAVAAAATGEGAMIGFYSGCAAALMVLVLVSLSRRVTLSLLPLSVVALACAAGAGAAYGVATMDHAASMGAYLAFAVGGMLFGALAAQSIIPSQARSRRHSPKGQRVIELIPTGPQTVGSVPLRNKTRGKSVLYIILGVLVAASVVIASFVLFSQGPNNESSPTSSVRLAIAPTGVPIAPNNAASLTELAKIEVGGISQAVFSKDGATLAVAAGEGVDLYDSATLTVRQSIASGPSRRIALSPDDTTLATIAGQNVQLWQVADGKLIRTLSGHTLEIEDLTFSPDGRMLATASLDRTARLWRVSTGELLYALPHVGMVHSIVFSASGDRLVTGSTMGTTLWQSSTGIRLALLDIVFATVHGVSFGADDQRVAAVISSGILRIWESDTHLRLHNLAIEEALNALAYSPDGKVLAVGGKDQQVRLLQAEDATIAGMLTGHRGIITSISFHPAGHLLATAASDGTLRLWGMTSSEVQPTAVPTALRTPTVAATATVTAVAISTPAPTATAIPKRQASAPAPTAITTMTTTSYTPIVAGNADEIIEQFALEMAATDLVYSADGQWIAVASPTQVLLLDGATFKQSATLDAVATRLAISPDNQHIATAKGDVVTLWSLPEGKAQHQLEIHADTVTDLAFSPGGQVLATASLDHRVRLWNVADGALLFEFSHFGAVHSLAFSPDNTQLVAGTTAGMTIWRLTDGARLRVLALTNHVAYRMAYSPDGTDLTAAMSNGEIWLWHLDTGGRATTLTGHAGPVRALTFSPGGELLASAADDGTIHLWRSADGADLRVLLGHTQAVTALSFNPAGTLLLSASQDGTVRLWASPSGS